MSTFKSFACLLIAIAPALFAQGVVTTIAGTDWLFPGDGRPAVNAPLSGVFGGPDIAVDSAGNVYVCDVGNGVVLRIGPDGMVNVVAGNGLTSYALAGDGGELRDEVAHRLDFLGRFFLVAGLDRVFDFGAGGVHGFVFVHRHRAPAFRIWDCGFRIFRI